MKTKLSIAIATYNEEHKLKDCLDSVHSWVDEIVLVDGSSIDQTVKIAQEYKKTKVIITTNKPIFHINKQKAIDECKGDWILQLDADEIVTPELKKEIQALIKKDSETLPSGYFLKRKNLFLGHYFKKSGQYPDPVIRLFQKGRGRLPCKSVHEQMEIKGEVSTLNEHLLHHPYETFSEYLVKSNRYTTLSAQELLDQKQTPSFIKQFIFLPFKTFFTIYIRCKGFMDGFPGFVFALFSALHHKTAYIKYHELKKDRN